jgi:hypothetical protein
MKVISINSAPSVCNEDDILRHDVTDLNKILSRIDGVEGRNDALRAYIYALRDLQRAHDSYSFGGEDGEDAAIDRAQAAVDETFDSLIAAQHRLSRSAA